MPTLSGLYFTSDKNMLVPVQDLTLSDNDNKMYMLPVVAAQQVLDLSLKIVILGKK